MANTTNFGWETPDDTDLVKDGALAMRTLGNAIDTSLVDLKGGTTGQVLSKNTNTDMDFTWVTPNDADAIQNSIVDAKGDLISATADNTPARLASSGVNGQVLTIDTTTSTGLKWAAPAGGITWESWTPTYNASIAGNATVTARKAKSGNSAFFYFNFVYGSTSNFSASAYPGIQLPYTSANYRNIFYGFAIDVSAGDSFQILFEQGSSDQYMYPSASNAAGTYLKVAGAGLNIQSSIPFSWATGDILVVIGQYEAA